MEDYSGIWGKTRVTFPNIQVGELNKNGVSSGNDNGVNIYLDKHEWSSFPSL